MGYISYFDLLGTRGFKDNSYEYEKNINIFYSEIRKGASYLCGFGEIGIFSDSVYVYSRDLERLLHYLMYLRNSLCSRGLFFNAVVSHGELNILDTQEWKIDVPVYGVGFTDNSIINLYLEQTRFKGIGIKIDESIVEKVKDIKSIKISNSFFYSSSSTPDLILYYDIAYDIKNAPYKNKMKNTVKAITKSALKAYSVNINHGKYYTSLFSTILDSYDYKELDWSWDDENKKFYNLPEIFNTIINISTGKYKECINWIGIDALCLKIIDMAISSEKINDRNLKKIITNFINYPYLKKYMNSLETLPQVFTSSKNKDKFLDYVQDYITYDLVNKLISK